MFERLEAQSFKVEVHPEVSHSKGEKEKAKVCQNRWLFYSAL